MKGSVNGWASWRPNAHWICNYKMRVLLVGPVNNQCGIKTWMAVVFQTINQASKLGSFAIDKFY